MFNFSMDSFLQAMGGNRGGADRDRGFERELEAMGDIKHRNIVTLNGYYTAPHYNLFIYELVAYEGLDGVLHGRSLSNKHLDWLSRYKIALGAAKKNIISSFQSEMTDLRRGRTWGREEQESGL